MDKRMILIIVGVVVVAAIIVLYILSKKLGSTNAITISNSQSIATPSNFQQLLTLDLSKIISSPSQLLNLKFCSDLFCTQPLYAWIQQYSSDFSTVSIWVKLPNGIPASSSTKIYMQLTSTNQYPYTGIAPTLSGTYGQYDNGEYVFNFYDNFAGTTLKSWWAVPSGSNYAVNNGFIAKPSGGETTAVYNPNILENSSIIAEWYVDLSSTTYPGGNVDFQLNRYTPESNEFLLGVQGSLTLYNNNTAIQSVSIPSSGSYVFGVWNNKSKVTWFYPGGSYTGTGLTAETDYLALMWSVNGAPNAPTVHYVRTRAYPPNGVMPTVSV